MYLKYNGSVGIGTTAPNVPLEVNRTSDGIVLRAGDGAGTCDINPGAAADWSCSSDIKFKENIRDLEPSLDTIQKLQPRRFTEKGTGNEKVGFVAQEVIEVLPDMVDESDPDNLKLSTGPLIPRLVKAVQELNEKVEKLELENIQLKQMIELKQ